jgi:hypothetical protein
MRNTGFRKLLIAAAVAALLGNRADAAPAGTVDFTVGGVTATGTDGRERPLAKGAEVNAGDRIVTTDGRAQIRFVDGAFVSLQPQTEFAIREYRYDGRTDGSERGVFGLVRGALRTVTGAIGRVNRNAYQIQTPTATIGIRGTGGLIAVGADGQTTITGTSGTWVLTSLNNRSLEVPAGQAATIRPGPNAEPQKSTQGPLVPPPPLLPTGEQAPGSVSGASAPPQDNVVAADIVRDETGTPAALPPPSDNPTTQPPPVTPPPPNPNPPLVTGSPYDMSYAVGGTMPMSGNLAQTLSTFNATGQLTDADGTPAGKFTLASGSHAEFGTQAGVVAWGRWIGTVSSTVSPIPTQTFGTNDGLHYVTGVPAPIGALNGVGSVTYNLAGATSPTNGTATGVVTGGQLVANLGPSPTVNLQNFSLNIGANTYVMNKAGMAITGPNTPFSGNLFGFDFSGSSGLCSTMCSGTVNGHFYGANASHAGITYQINNSFPSPEKVVGAAVFKK